MKGLIELKERYLNLIAGDDFDYDKFNAFAILHHSNAIEGSTLTKEETYFLLSERLTVKNKPVAYSLMAIDHLDALKCVLKLASSKTPLGSVILRAISARLNEKHRIGNLVNGRFFRLFKRGLSNAECKSGDTHFLKLSESTGAGGNACWRISTKISGEKTTSKA